MTPKPPPTTPPPLDLQAEYRKYPEAALRLKNYCLAKIEEKRQREAAERKAA